ncbi:hypothetical protein MMC14_002916 [Varicellaria rhodocarpa]|nr:hypothetical protein [Varicellaria rhodocarpa]
MADQDQSLLPSEPDVKLEAASIRTSLQRYGFQPPAISPQKLSTRSSSTASIPISTFPLKKRLIEEPSPSTSPKLKKPKRPASSYAPPSKYASLGNNLTDSLALNLICMFIGVNPGLRTATAGHAYAHPSNLFWRLLHSSGCTPRRCAPEEDGDLPHLFDLGNTNIVTRPTKDASELSKAEMDEGVWVLEEKIKKWRPESVAIVGKGIWESIWRVKHGKGIRKEEFRYGWQEENWGAVEYWEGARVFVATSTSGLAVGMRLDEKEAVWRELGEWVEKRREERRMLLNAKEEAQVSIPTPSPTLAMEQEIRGLQAEVRTLVRILGEERERRELAEVALGAHVCPAINPTNNITASAPVPTSDLASLSVLAFPSNLASSLSGLGSLPGITVKVEGVNLAEVPLQGEVTVKADQQT